MLIWFKSLIPKSPIPDTCENATKPFEMIKWLSMFAIYLGTLISAVLTVRMEWNEAKERDKQGKDSMFWSSSCTSIARLLILVLITIAGFRELWKAGWRWGCAKNSWLTWVTALSGTIG